MKNGGMETKKYNRWIPVIAGILIQLCLGTAYIWGVFQPEVVSTLEWSQKNAALTFSFLLGVLTFGSTVGGLIQDKFSPRPVIIVGGLILGSGFFLASFTTPQNAWMMWLTYGVLGGFGMGTTYTTTIAVCQKWFPDKRGLITGIIVSALGFGGLVFTPVANILIKNRGVMETFSWFAVIFIVVTTICGFFIKNPPADFVPKGWKPPEKKAGQALGHNFAPSEVLKTPQFYMITIALMASSAAGLMVIPFAKVLGISEGLSKEVATLGVSIIAGFNSFGRLFWGWISDKIGRKNTLLLLMLLAGTTILFVSSAKSYWILATIGLVGFSYGGFLGVFPALTADFWGTKNMGVNYGMVLLGFGVGAIASSYIAGYFKDLTGGFTIPFIVASAASFIGAILIFFVKNPVHSSNK